MHLLERFQYGIPAVLLTGSVLKSRAPLTPVYVPSCLPPTSPCPHNDEKSFWRRIAATKLNLWEDPVGAILFPD